MVSHHKSGQPVDAISLADQYGGETKDQYGGETNIPMEYESEGFKARVAEGMKRLSLEENESEPKQKKSREDCC